MKKFFQHFILVTRHRHRVMRNAAHLGIFFHSLGHDLSKYSKEEFLRSYKYYSGNESPIFKERFDNDLYSRIANHHCSKNKHHYEYYIDFYKGNVLTRNIPYCNALEMVADMISASQVYLKNDFNREYVLRYFQSRQEGYIMTDGSYEFLEECFKTYVESGFEFLKRKHTKRMYQQIMSKYPPVKYYKLSEISREEVLKF
ncbi:MAG TPA: DUF5662 family protein [Candidatus Onthovivens sp.]|nr:DUF5662 family protein [Candidatus Onthovivens sp.]